MAPGAVLLLVEQVLPGRLEAGAAASQRARLDLQMLLLTPGGASAPRRNTVPCCEAGLELRSVVPTESSFSIVEGVPSWPQRPRPYRHADAHPGAGPAHQDPSTGRPMGRER